MHNLKFEIHVVIKTRNKQTRSNKIPNIKINLLCATLNRLTTIVTLLQKHGVRPQLKEPNQDDYKKIGVMHLVILSISFKEDSTTSNIPSGKF